VSSLNYLDWYFSHNGIKLWGHRQLLGDEAKVETQGATGLENEITQEDCQRADACIIASDIKIKDIGRFKDVPTMTIGVSEAVKCPDEIIKELLEAIE